MRCPALGVLLLVLASACGTPVRSAEREAPPIAETATTPAAPAPSAEPPKRALASCIAVAQEGAGAPASVEGTIATGKDGLFVLRLAKPRCVVGLPGASFIAEVAVVSSGFDLRPLVGARVRANGEAIAGQTDLGGPAVVVIVKDVSRAEPEHGP